MADQTPVTPEDLRTMLELRLAVDPGFSEVGAMHARRTASVLPLLVAALLAVSSLLLDGPSAASQPEDHVLSANLQDVPDLKGEFTVKSNGSAVSALPFRLRVDNQASPLVYSLDLRRQPEFDSSWRAFTRVQESLNAVGVRNPALAVLIARGNAPSGQKPVLARGDLGYAARQVAIWHYSNDLQISDQTVPDSTLRDAAQNIVDATESAQKNGAQVPLQPASYGVDIFIRETTATHVRLGVALRLDANTSLDSSQNIDLYLDGSKVEIKTHYVTHVSELAGGGYGRDRDDYLGSGKNELAEVLLERNTKVVDAEAVWVGVESDPGFVMISDGSSPPVITAESAVYSFRKRSSLDPSSYTGPGELLTKTATIILTYLPGPLSIIAIILALYLFPRIGKGVDALFKKGFGRVKRRWASREAKARRRTTRKPKRTSEASVPMPAAPKLGSDDQPPEGSNATQ